MKSEIEIKKEKASQWFRDLRDAICLSFEDLEQRFGSKETFRRKNWSRSGGGGGEMSLLYGDVFESVGVNISTVYGNLPEAFAHEIPGTQNSKEFWASGISIVAHMVSPWIPAIHMNTRFICTENSWFGGGIDLTPAYPDEFETNYFHSNLKDICDNRDPNFYPKFKDHCDKYFFLAHRNEPRGIGGIFFDYLQENWEQDFQFIKNVGQSIIPIFSWLVERNAKKQFGELEREILFQKRGRYVEFNLLYDRGTRFGLMTNGNVEAILVSLPPIVKWHKDRWI